MIELHTLGRIDLTGVDDDAARSVVRAPKRLGLLAYLAVAGPGEHVRRDTLVTLFWPDHDASRARHALRNTLYELRQALGGDVVRGRGKEELAVDPERLRCDAVAFREALAQGRREDALELYGGELLPGFHVDGAAPAFERWLEERRRSLRRDARRAANALSRASEEQGRVPEAIRWTRRSLELDPFDEPVVRRLMRLLARSGNRGAAVRAYRDFADRLEDRLGLAPDEETGELLAEIRSSGGPETMPEAGEGASGPGAGTSGERKGIERAAAAERGGPSGRDDRSRGGEDRPPTPDGDGAGSPRRARRRGAVVAGGAVLLLAAAWLLPETPWAVDSGTSQPPGSAVESLSGERLAVLPFRVRAEDGLGRLAGGLGGLLATGLDGAGGLRTVDPHALTSRVEALEAPLDTDAASRVAEELDAGLYVLGEAFASGGELRLTAAMYRPGASTPVARTEVEGRRERALGLVDRLAAGLLASAYPEARLRFVRQAGRTTRSLEALKEYLTGEQAFRRGRFTAASEAYQRAVILDTAFALAHHRLSVTSEWLGNRELAQTAAERAVRHAERLVERDRRLLEAHLTSLDGDAAEAERQYRAILATWPHDLEAWYQLGEILFHYGPAVGRSITEAEEAFERVRSLHPTHVPSLVHLARIAATEDRRERVARLAERVRALVPDSRHAWEMRALGAFVAGDASARAGVIEGLEEASGQSVRLAVWSVAVFGHELEAAGRLSELMTSPRRSPEIRDLGRTWRAQLALAGGRWREAWPRLGAPGSAAGGPTTGPPRVHPRPLFTSLDFLPVPDSTLEAARRALQTSAEDPEVLNGDAGPEAGRGGPRSQVRRFGLALLCSRVGDYETALSRAREIERAGEASGGLATAGRLTRLIRAHVAWRRERPDRGLSLLGAGDVETRSAFMYGSELLQPFERYLHAVLLADAGRTEEALRWFGSFANQQIPNLVYLAPSHLHRARLLENAGRAGEARRHYRALLRLWSRTDPELRPFRREAESRIAALTGR